MVDREDISIGPSSFVSFKEGKISKNYRIERELSNTKYCKVYLVTHKLTNIPRVLKCVNKEAVKQDDCNHFFSEAEILRELDHPNITKLFEIYQDDKAYILVTEYCAGEDLFSRIVMENHYSEKGAADHMKQILYALSYLHEKGIVHTNLNGDNILLSSDAIDSPLKLRGFGFARSINAPHVQEKMDHQRDLFHCAPEVLQGSSDPKSDIWSCGVLLCEMLTGMPPFFGENNKKVTQAIVNGELDFSDNIWKDISEDALELVQKMLKLNPKERLSAQDALKHPWFSKNLTNSVNLKILQNMRHFHARHKLKRALLSLIATQMTSEDELKELRETFSGLDKDGNGVISREELIEGYKRYFKDNVNAEEEALKILDQVDFDHSGLIEFTGSVRVIIPNFLEFVIAASDRKKLLSKEKLEKAFKLLDSNKNGSISRSELSSVLGGLHLDDAQWSELVSEGDQNNDGVISKEEFVELMTMKSREL